MVLVLILTLLAGAAGAASAQADGTIVATKGGDRSASANVSGATTYASPVSGATFEYTSGNPTSPGTTWTAFPAATGANGQAQVTVANGIYYVREKTGGPGFSNYGPVTNLSYNGNQPYVARVNVQTNQTTYAFPHTNTDGTPSNWSPTNGGSASNNGSPFINVRDNDTLPPGCGTNILLVLDRSGSIDPFKSVYEQAAKEFVSQLNGTPTQIGIISFNDDVNSYSPAVGDSDFYQSPLSLNAGGSAATLNSTIEDIYDSPDSLTNWDGALNAASQAKGFTPDAGTGQSANPDMVVFITDGNPTTSEASTSSGNADLINLTSGMASANLVKNQAGRAGKKVKMLAIGVGSGVTVDNLKVVSGPTEGVDGDFAAPTIPELQSFLSELAASQCGARVYVRKRVTGQATNQAGWFYTATDPRPGKTPTYQDGNRATHSSGNPPVIETGAFFSQLPGTPTTVNVNEDAAGQPLGNFELTSVDCRYDAYDGGTTVPGGVKNGLNYSLPVNRGDSIYCTYVNSLKTTITVSKTPDAGVINAGDDAEFTIQVSNTGSNTATGVSLSDALPSPGVGGWTISSQPGGNPCSIAANSLSCSFGNLNAGASVTVKVKTGTSFAACGTYDNPVATASAANAPTVTNAGKITCNKPNLSITKTGNGPVNAGQDVEFTVQVSNGGPGVAKSVTLSDPLPGGTAGAWSIVSQPAGNPCSIAVNLLTCNFGDMNAGASASVKVKAPTSNANCTSYDNTGTASSTNAPNAVANASVTCNKPSLGTLKTAVQGTISAGDNAEFSITVSNAGPGTANAVTLSDPLPTGVSGAWTIDSQPPGNPCSITAGTLNCNFGSLAAGASVIVTVKAPTNFENCATLVNLATASSSNSPSASDDATIHCDKPNLSVVKTGNGPVDAGDAIQFTVDVSNAGPGVARGVSLSDPLPSGTAAGWVIVSQPAGNPCSIPADTLSCSFGDMAAGTTKTVTVKADTDFEDCTTYDNTATASATNSPSAADDASIACDKPDLSIFKTGNSTVNAGQDVEFTIQVANAGPGVAKNVMVSDPLPGGTAGAWTIVSQPAGDPCAITAGVLNCSFGDMAAAASAQITVTSATDSEHCATYDNTATGTADNAPDESAEATVKCESPDLSVEKTGNGPVNAGEDVEFTITVANSGPGEATGVVLNDPLPAGVAGSWVIDSQPAGDPCSITAGVLECDFGDLADGASVEVTVKAPTSYADCSIYDNDATASSTNQPDVSDDATVTCQKPDISVEKTGNGTINAGQDVEFTINVSNAGPGVAKAVTLNDPLPTGTAGAWTIVSQPAGDPCAIVINVLSCAFGDMPAGASAEVMVESPTDHDGCKVFDNTATATATGVPGVEGSASVNCQRAELGVLKTAVQGTISAGDEAQFSISVTNAGPGVATGVTLSDPLPTGVSGAWTIDSQPAGDPCSITAGVLNCSFGDLDADETVVVTVTAPTDFEQCGTLVNLATASATNTPDASDSDTINCNKPDMSVVKTAVQGTISAGDEAQFSISVTNAGPGVAKGVTLNDPLPPGVSGPWTIDSQPAGDPCSITTGVLSCDFGDLDANVTVTVTVTASTDFEQCGTLANLATASSTNAPDATGSATIVCQKPNLTIVKTGNGPIDAGEDVLFTINVANTGPGTANDVVLNDPLPGGTAGDWSILSQPAGDPCSIASNVLNCEFGDLAPGASAQVQVTAATSLEQCVTYDNSATASADNSLTVSGDASVACDPPGLAIVKTGNGTVQAGKDVKFTMTVSNNGNGVATAVTLSDPLPSGTAGGWSITSQPAGDPCSIAGQLLSCSFGDLAPGATVTVEVAAATSNAKCTTYDNTATASGSNAGIVTGQDTVTCALVCPLLNGKKVVNPNSPATKEALRLCPKPRIELKKTANKKKVFPNETVKYKIWVRNTRKSSLARNLKICDRLPAKMTVVSKGPGAFFDKGRLCWRIKSLGYSKKWKTFSYVARVDADVDAGEKLKNVVTVGNKRATWTVVVKSPPVSPARQDTPVTG